MTPSSRNLSSKSPDPSDDESLTATISRLSGTAHTRRTSDATVRASLYTGIMTETRSAGVMEPQVRIAISAATSGPRPTLVNPLLKRQYQDEHFVCIGGNSAEVVHLGLPAQSGSHGRGNGASARPAPNCLEDELH